MNTTRLALIAGLGFSLMISLSGRGSIIKYSYPDVE
jgi:hypothetical protein